MFSIYRSVTGKEINSDKSTEGILADFLQKKKCGGEATTGWLRGLDQKKVSRVCASNLITCVCSFYFSCSLHFIYTNTHLPISKMNFMSFRYATIRNLQTPSSTSSKRYYDASVLHSPLRQIKLNPIYIIA